MAVAINWRSFIWAPLEYKHCHLGSILRPLIFENYHIIPNCIVLEAYVQSRVTKQQGFLSLRIVFSSLRLCFLDRVVVLLC